MTADALLPDDGARMTSDGRRKPRSSGARSHARRGTEPHRSRVPEGNAPAAQSGASWVPLQVEQACSSALQRLNGGTAASVAVTSSVRGEGRTTVALGSALAQMHEYGRKVALLELDVAAPALAARLGIPGRPGLSDLLGGDVALDAALHWPLPSLAVLTAGTASLEPARLLARFARSGVVQQLEEDGYCVVADLPPLPPAGPGDRVVDLFSGTLFVVRAGRTSASTVRAAVTALAEPPAVVLNARESALPRWLRSTFGD